MRVLLIVVCLLATGCVSVGSASTFSPLAKQLSETEKEVDLSKFKNKKELRLKLPEQHRVTAIDKENIAALDAERRALREMVVELESAINAKNRGVSYLIEVIELLEVENKINSRLAQKALVALDESETRNKVNDYMIKGMSLANILMLLLPLL